MTNRVQDVLETIEELSNDEKRELVAEILRRCGKLDWPPLTEEDFVCNAEERFLELDQAESADGSTHSW